VSQSSIVQIVNKDLSLKCFKRRRAQKLTESNKLARLVRSRQLLKRYQEHDVAFIWFTDEKIFTVAAPSNSQNDRVYAARDTLKKQIAAKRLLRTRNTFSQLIMVSVGVSKLVFRRSRHKNKRCIYMFFYDRNCCQRFDVFQIRILSSSRTVHLHIVRVKLWRFCVEKHQTSILQICGLQTVQISIQLITRSGQSCLPEENSHHRRTEAEAD